MRFHNIPIDNSISQFPPERPAINLQVLEQLRSMIGYDTPHMMAGLIENYLENAPNLLAELPQIISNKEQLSQTVETLKHSSISFGAEGLCALCDDLLQCGDSATEDALAIISQIGLEYERVKLVLEAEWQRLYELRLKTDIFYPTGSCKNIGFYPK